MVRKTVIVAVTMLVLCTTTAFGQFWATQTSNVTATLYGVKAVSSSLVWACGDQGKVLRTTDGGTTWAVRTTFTLSGWSLTCYSVEAFDANRAWVVIVGDSSSRTMSWLGLTTDGGVTWSYPVSSATSGTFFDAVRFYDASNGIMMGDPENGYFVIYTTTNGGASWSRTPQSSIPSPPQGEYGYVNHLSVFGNSAWFGTFASRVFRSTDRGKTWSVSTPPSGLGNFLSSSSFASEQVGLVLGGNGSVVRTTNGGATWGSPITTGMTAGYGVTFVTSSALVGVGDGGNTSVGSSAVSTDGGSSWSVRSTPAGRLYAVSFASSSVGWAVGSSGTILKWVGGDLAVSSPTVTTSAATSVGSSGATFNGSVNPNGLATTAWFEYGTGSTLATSASTAAQSVGSGTSVLSVSQALGALSAGTTYYFRVVGQNSAGTTRGSILNFTTSSLLAGEYTADANTVLLLHMNETSGTTVSDVSSFGNNGTATGTTIVDGRFGKARSFNGNGEWIDLGLTQIGGNSNELTVECWVRAAEPPAVGAALVERSDDQYSGGATRVFRLELTPEGRIGFGVNNIPPSQGLGLSSPSVFVFENSWQHVAATYSSTFGVKIYRNGIKIAETSSTIGPVSNLLFRTSVANKFNSVPSQWFKGTMDEIRVSNKARAPNEFNLQLPPRDLAATTSGTTISLTWQNGGGAVGLLRYKIYRGTDSTNVSLIDSTSSASYSNTGLTAGTRYFYRISAVDATGFEGAKGYAASAITTAVPTVTTTAATAVTSTTATLNGSVNPNGSSTTAYFEWGTSSTLATSAATSSQSIGSGTSAVSVTANLSGLSSSTIYYYRVVGQNSAGTQRGSIVSFTTTGAAAMTLSTSSLSFGTVNVGSSSQQTFTVSNTGAATLTVSSVTSDNVRFTVSPTSFSVAAGASPQTVTVTFSPTAATVYSGTITLSHNAAGGSSTVSVSGTGSATPAISLSASSLSFGSVNVGSSSQQSFAVSNTGNATLAVSSLSSSSSSFSASPTSFNVSVGGSPQSVTVTFSPTSGGSQTGTITLTHNAAGGSSAVAVSGTGETRTSGLATSTGRFSSGIPASSWVLMSVPFTLDNQAASALASQLSGQNAWKMYAYVSGSNQETTNTGDAFQLTRGFWFKTVAKSAAFTLSFGSGTLAGGSTYQISVPTGWSLIGPPFYNNEATWSPVNTTAGSSGIRVWKYAHESSSWVGPLSPSVEPMKPFGGYAVYNQTGAAATFTFMRGNPSSKIVSEWQEGDGWYMIVQVGSAALRIGQHRGAEGGLAAYNYPMPPSRPEREGEDPYLEGKLWSDIRPVSESTPSSWRVSVDPKEANSIEMKEVNDLPSGWKVVAVGIPNSDLIDLTKRQSYLLPPDVKLPFTMQILAGPATSLDKEIVPDGFVLHQNYPNPFNPTTNIGYELARETILTLTIYNLLGNEVVTLVHGNQKAGTYEVRWNGTDSKGLLVTSGLYICRIQSRDFVASRKMLFLR